MNGFVPRRRSRRRHPSVEHPAVNGMQGVIPDYGRAVGTAPRHVLAEVGVVGLCVRCVDPRLQLGDESVDGLPGGV